MKILSKTAAAQRAVLHRKKCRRLYRAVFILALAAALLCSYRTLVYSNGYRYTAAELFGFRSAETCAQTEYHGGE